MADEAENFRPKVDPARARVEPEPWPDGYEPDEEGERSARGEQGGDADANDLLGAFDVVARAVQAGRGSTPPAQAPVSTRNEPDTFPDDLSPTPLPQVPPTPLPPLSLPSPLPDRPAPPSAATPTPDPREPAEAEPRRRRPSSTLIATIAVIGLCAATTVAVVESQTSHDPGHSATTSSGSPGASPSASASTPASIPDPQVAAAVAWVLSAVGPTHVVACSPSVCAMLQARGFPPASLIQATGPIAIEQADVVILTGPLRADLGDGAQAIVGPQPLAVFGTGESRVVVAPVALAGQSAYTSAMATDLRARGAAGAALAGNARITMTPAAAADLLGGRVDIRVCDLLALLAGSQTLTLAGFTSAGPGAGPDIPLAGVIIADADGMPATGTSAAAASLLATLRAQPAPYQPMAITPTSGPPRGLVVTFSQPGPLGLLSTDVP